MKKTKIITNRRKGKKSISDEDTMKSYKNDDELKKKHFKKELEIMKVEFDLYLKKKYADIVGEKM